MCPPAMVASQHHLTVMKGFICDDPTGSSSANAMPCINQDIVDKVNEIMFYWSNSSINPTVK